MNMMVLTMSMRSQRGQDEYHQGRTRYRLEEEEEVLQQLNTLQLDPPFNADRDPLKASKPQASIQGLLLVLGAIFQSSTLAVHGCGFGLAPLPHVPWHRHLEFSSYRLLPGE